MIYPFWYWKRWVTLAVLIIPLAVVVIFTHVPPYVCILYGISIGIFTNMKWPHGSTTGRKP